MLLKDLDTGKRFMFEDRKTPLALTVRGGQHVSTGTFKYHGVGESVCPVLWHEETGKQVTVVSGTLYRSVLPIF